VVKLTTDYFHAREISTINNTLDLSSQYFPSSFTRVSPFYDLGFALTTWRADPTSLKPLFSFFFCWISKSIANDGTADFEIRINFPFLMSLGRFDQCNAAHSIVIWCYGEKLCSGAAGSLQDCLLNPSLHHRIHADDASCLKIEVQWLHKDLDIVLASRCQKRIAKSRLWKLNAFSSQFDCVTLCSR